MSPRPRGLAGPGPARRAPTGLGSPRQNVVPGHGPRQASGGGGTSPRPSCHRGFSRLGARGRGLINTYWPHLPACLLGCARQLRPVGRGSAPLRGRCGCSPEARGRVPHADRLEPLRRVVPRGPVKPRPRGPRAQAQGPARTLPSQPRRGTCSGSCPGFLTRTFSSPLSGKSERTSWSLGASGRSTPTA